MDRSLLRWGFFSLLVALLVSSACSRGGATGGGGSGDGDGDLGGASGDGDGDDPGDGDGDRVDGDGDDPGDGDGDFGGDSGDGDLGGASGDGDGAGTLEDLTDYCDAAYDHVCTWFEACRGFDCTQGGPAQNLRANCDDELIDQFEDGLLVISADALACIPTAIDCGIHPLEPFRSGECSAVLSTGAELGDECQSGGSILAADCAEGYCDTSDVCPGTCAAYAEPGTDCSERTCAPGSACIDGTCVEAARSGDSCEEVRCFSLLQCRDDVCVSPGSVGDPCGDDAPCSAGLSCAGNVCSSKVGLGELCANSWQCPTGSSCFAPSPNGEPICTTHYDDGEACTGPECGPDSICDLTCQPLGKSADPCEPYGCAEGFWCWYPASGAAEDGECRPVGGSGDSCSSEAMGPRSEDQRPCLQDPTHLYCVDGKCRDAGELGEPCNPARTGSCQEGNWCSFETETCLAPAGEGSACNLRQGFDQSCEEGLFCDCPSENCESESEDEGTCIALKENGALCEVSGHCASNICAYVEEDDVSRCAVNTSCGP